MIPLLDMDNMQLHKRWDELHEVLVETALVVALLGAWTHHHNLRGDGEILQQAKDLLWKVVEALDIHFDSCRFPGSDAVRTSLAANGTWCLLNGVEVNKQIRED